MKQLNLMSIRPCSQQHSSSSSSNHLMSNKTPIRLRISHFKSCGQSNSFTQVPVPQDAIVINKKLNLKPKLDKKNLVVCDMNKFDIELRSLQESKSKATI